MKILIIYASAGAGHKKAAEAVYEALAENIDKKDIAIIDALDYSNRFFKWLYSKKYLTLVNYMPSIWGFFYYFLDVWIVYKLIRLPRRIINAINCQRLEEFICQYNPQIVLSTHFMANEIVSHLKKKGRINCRLFSAVTDYRLHSFWVTPGVDCYFVAVEQTRADLIKRGVPPDKIRVTGVPISPKFSLKMDKKQERVKLGLNPNLFTALIIGGGFGVGPVEGLVRNIGAISAEIQLLVVCGYNKILQKDVEKIVSDLKLKAKVYGFIDNIHQLMSASDIMVTKSGGLTSSEALVKALPAIFVRPIPGQEKRNSRVLQESGAAFIAAGPNGVRREVKELFENPGHLQKMAASSLAIARPNSARNIAVLATTD